MISRRPLTFDRYHIVICFGHGAVFSREVGFGRGMRIVGGAIGMPPTTSAPDTTLGIRGSGSGLLGFRLVLPKAGQSPQDERPGQPGRTEAIPDGPAVF